MLGCSARQREGVSRSSEYVLGKTRVLAILGGNGDDEGDFEGRSSRSPIIIMQPPAGSMHLPQDSQRELTAPAHVASSVAVQRSLQRDVESSPPTQISM